MWRQWRGGATRHLTRRQQCVSVFHFSNGQSPPYIYDKLDRELRKWNNDATKMASPLMRLFSTQNVIFVTILLTGVIANSMQFFLFRHFLAFFKESMKVEQFCIFPSKNIIRLISINIKAYSNIIKNPKDFFPASVAL